MKIRALTSWVAGLTICASAVALVSTPGAPVSYSGGTYTVRTAASTVEITPFTDDIFRVTTVPAGTRTFALPESQAAILKPQPMQVASFVTPEEFSLVSPTTVVKVNRQNGKVVFTNAEGEVLLTEAEGVDNSGKVKTVSHLQRKNENF